MPHYAVCEIKDEVNITVKMHVLATNPDTAIGHYMKKNKLKTSSGLMTFQTCRSYVFRHFKGRRRKKKIKFSKLKCELTSGYEKIFARLMQ